MKQNAAPTMEILYEYLGQCTRRNGSIAYFLVTHQRADGGEFEPISDARRLFPKKGEVELHGLEALKTPIGAERLFTIKPNNHFRAASEHMIASLRSLAAYKHWGHVSSLVNARKILFKELDGFTPGPWAIRLGSDEVVQFELVDDSSGSITIPPACVTEIPVYKFDTLNLVRKADEKGVGTVYYAAEKTTPIRFVNWQSDKEYLKTLLLAAERAAEDQKGDRNIAGLIEFLDTLSHSPAGSIALAGSLSLIAPLDRETVIDSVRTGEIFKLLRFDESLLTHVIGILRGDPAFEDLRQQAVEKVATEAREDIVRRLSKEINAEVKAKANAEAAEIIARAEAAAADAVARADVSATQKIEDSKSSAAQLETQLLEAIDSRLKAYEDEQRRAASARLEAANSTARAALDAAEQRRSALVAEADARKADIAHLQEGLDAYATVRTNLLAEIETLSAVTSSLRQQQLQPRSSISPYAVRNRDGATAVCPDEWKKRLAECTFLTKTGRVLMAQFASLLFAGEVPVIVGVRTLDFALLAGFMICGARQADFACDPTIVTVDDLWIRVGSGVPTAFGQALAESMAGGAGAPVLAVIKEPEQSASRHWVAPLAELAQQGAFMGRFLPCIAVIQMSGEFAESAKDRPRLLVDDAFAAEAVTAAALSFAHGSNGCSELCIKENPNIVQDAQDVSALAPPSIRHGLRVLRILSYARQLMDEKAALIFTESVSANFRSNKSEGTKS